MKAYVHDGQYFMWAIENSVGKGAMNGLAADVSYIQWYYALAANFPEVPPERKAIYNKVKVTGQCSGLASDPLVQAIIAHQQGMNHPVVDGKVSVVSGNSGGLRLDSDSAFFVVRLGARFAVMYPEQWPRLDKIPGCPPVLAEAVRNAVPTL